MVDTARTLAALQTLLADNTSGDISPQDIRDLLVSLFALTTKGDILGIDGSGIITRLAAGGDTEVLTLDSGEATGMKWAAAGGHTEAHSVASHDDTTATGTELETLTDGSDADALHNHPSDLTPAEHTAIGDSSPHHSNATDHANTLDHAEAHAPESHTGQGATAAELETLTDTSDADALHAHARTDSHLDAYNGSIL